MNQEVAVVEQNPFRGVVTLYADRKLSHAFEEVADLVGNCLTLPLVCGSTDDEVVGKRCDFTQIENDQVFGFLRFRALGGNQPVRLIG